MERLAACAAVGIAILGGTLAVTPTVAQSALIEPLASRVMLYRAGVVVPLLGSQVARSGDTVVTDATGRAVVTYPDGSTTTLDPSSAITIEYARSSAGDWVIHVEQTVGRVWYAVARTLGLGGRYQVRTPAMASVVRAGSGSFVAADGSTITLPPAGTTLVVVAANAVPTVSPPTPGTPPVVTTVPVPTVSAPTTTDPAPAPVVAPEDKLPFVIVQPVVAPAKAAPTTDDLVIKAATSATPLAREPVAREPLAKEPPAREPLAKETERTCEARDADAGRSGQAVEPKERERARRDRK
jgi:hypothetical protein